MLPLGGLYSWRLRSVDRRLGHSRATQLQDSGRLLGDPSGISDFGWSRADSPVADRSPRLELVRGEKRRAPERTKIGAPVRSFQFGILDVPLKILSKPEPRFSNLNARRLPRVTGLDSSNKRLVDSNRHVTGIMLKRCAHVEATLDSEFWAPGRTTPLEEARFLGIPLKRPRRDLRQPFERFFASGRRSKGTGVPGPGT